MSERLIDSMGRVICSKCENEMNKTEIDENTVIYSCCGVAKKCKRGKDKYSLEWEDITKKEETHVQKK